MRILFTGISSFTGYWIAKELIENGNEIIAVLPRKSIDEYEGIKALRVKHIEKLADVKYGIKFGDDNFIRILENNKFDLFCYHSSYVVDYNTNKFKYLHSINENLLNIETVTDIIKSKEMMIIYTGSIFEGGEGIGTNLKPISLYGISKQHTFDVLYHYCNKKGIKLGKFVIPNPFGPYEEERFTNYLIRTWIKGETPIIKTPAYVRDNIHISLLAKAYIYFSEKLERTKEYFIQLNPSGYVESQETFALRIGKELSIRLGIKYPYTKVIQKELNEPFIRINNTKTDLLISNWNEKKAWDEYAEYYINLYLVKNND